MAAESTIERAEYALRKEGKPSQSRTDQMALQSA
jgi:hypothetical protein